MVNKKIGFICPSKSWGGLEMNVFKIAGWLTERGWEIILFGNPESLLYKKFLENNMTAYPLVSKSKLNDLLLVNKLADRIKKENIRLVILHITKNMPLAVLAKIFSGNFFKLLYMQHMHLGGSKNDFFHSWLYNKFDSWIAPLPLFSDYLKKHSRLDISKVAVIPFGIELARFTKNLPDKSSARRKLNLPDDITIVGMVGRLDEKKCQHVLIEACAAVHGAGHKIHVLLVGDKTVGEQTTYADNLYELTGKLGLDEYVHFVNGLTEVEYAYAALDIFSLTTGSETFGMVTIEAMASRLPVIATNDGGSRDIIQHKKNGLLVTPLDSDELAKSIILLIENPDTSNKLAGQGYRDALEKYSHTSQCENLEKLFSTIL